MFQILTRDHFKTFRSFLGHLMHDEVCHSLLLCIRKGNIHNGKHHFDLKVKKKGRMLHILHLICNTRTLSGHWRNPHITKNNRIHIKSETAHGLYGIVRVNNTLY